MNKHFGILCATFFAFCGYAYTASAESCGTGCTYTLENGVLTVTGTGDNASIQSSAFKGRSGITSVIIQGTIKTIGTDAFNTLKDLTSVDMSASQVETIKTGAFIFDKGGIPRPLTSVVLSPTLKTLEYAAFKKNSNLKSIELPEGLTTIGNQALGWTGIKELVIPTTVTSIDLTAGDAAALSHALTGLYCTAEQRTMCEDALIALGKSTDLLHMYEYDEKTKRYKMDGVEYGSSADLKTRTAYVPKEKHRIYTVEEAEKLSKPTGNKFMLRYK